jgi:hypothetical protein
MSLSGVSVLAVRIGIILPTASACARFLNRSAPVFEQIVVEANLKCWDWHGSQDVAYPSPVGLTGGHDRSQFAAQ